MNKEWAFSRNEQGQHKGIKYPGQAHFSGNRVRNAVREVIQNSLDARKEGKTVEITFAVEAMPAQIGEIAGDKLLEIITECRNDDKNQDSSAREIFDTSIAAINAKKRYILRISEKGTTGLNDKQWEGLVIDSGISPEKSDSTGGSWGIGKNAPFTVSNVRTVIYVSRYEKESGEMYTRMRGKTIQASRKATNKMRYEPDGFYGLCEEIEGRKRTHDIIGKEAEFYDPSNVFESGLTIMVVDFTDPRDGIEKMKEAVISNFFPAIYRKQLVVKLKSLEGSYLEVIDEKFLEDVGNGGAKIQGDKENLEKFKRHYLAFTQSSESEGSKVVKEIGDAGIQGNLIVYLRMAEDVLLNSRIALFRNTGMILTYEYKLLKAPGKKNCSVVVEFTGEYLCRAIRLMENVSHDRISHEELADDKHKRISKHLLEEINKNIKDAIKAFADQVLPDGDESDVYAENLLVPNTDTADAERRNFEQKGNVLNRIEGIELPRKGIVKMASGNDPIKKNRTGTPSEIHNDTPTRKRTGSQTPKNVVTVKRFRKGDKPGSYRGNVELSQDFKGYCSLYVINDSGGREKLQVVSATLRKDDGNQQSLLIKGGDIFIEAKQEELVDFDFTVSQLLREHILIEPYFSSSNI